MNLLEISHARGGFRGFTLIELLLVMALMLMVGTFMFPLGITFYRTQLLNESQEGLIAALRKAQVLSHTGVRDHSFGVKRTDTGYVLFEGDTYDSRIIANDELYFVPSTVVTTGIDEIVFNELTGIPSATTAIEISYGDRSVGFNVYPSGYIGE